MQRSLSAFARHFVAISLLLGNLPAHAAGGVDAVEFKPIPVNINNQCSSMILKGTSSYRGYAFKMPQVMLGIDKNFEDLFEVIPKGNGQYTLRFGLFFPMKNEALEIRNERSNLQVNYCNDDVIIAELNEADSRLADRDGTAAAAAKAKKTASRNNDGTVYEDKIQSLSPLPVSAIEVSLGGFALTKTIGNAEGSLLEYQNNNLIAEFTIPDEATYEELKAHLTGRIGLSVNLKFFFAARSGNGRADVHLDTRNLADSLEAALSGAAGLGDTVLGAGFVAEADLRGYMAKAIATTSVNIRTEEGDNDAVTRLANQLVERITSQIPGMPQVPGQQWNANACINNPLGPGCNGQNGGSWPTWPTGTGTNGGFPDANSTGTGTFNSPPPPAQGPPGPVLPHKDRDPNARYFSIGAVLNRIRQQQDIRLSFQNLGKRETMNYTRTEVIRGVPPAPGFRTFNVTAGDKQGETYTNFVKKGQEVTIKIPSSRENVTSYEKRFQYFSKDAIRRQGIANSFGLVQEALQKNQLIEIIDRENGGYVAIFKLNDGISKAKRWWREWNYGVDTSPLNVSWGLAELRRRTTMGAPTDLDLMNASDLSGIQMKVVFSELGKRYSIAELAQDRAGLWTSRFEDGEIILTAQRDLGYINFRNYAPVDTPNRREEKYIFEVKTPAEQPKIGTEEAAKDFNSRRTWTWLKYTGESGSGVEAVKDPSEDLKPFSITKKVFVVMVKTAAATEAPVSTWPSMPKEPTPAPVAPQPLANAKMTARQKRAAKAAAAKEAAQAKAAAKTAAKAAAPTKAETKPAEVKVEAKPAVQTAPAAATNVTAAKVPAKDKDEEEED